jgi:glycerate kinase
MRISGVPDTVLVAPDSFKGSFSARQVAAAIQEGLAASGQPAVTMPVADGGEGTLDALVASLALAPMRSPAHDPLGRPVEAAWALSSDGIAVIEVAAASGYTLIAPEERDPIAASSYGTGELIMAAVAAGAQEIVITAGGSATSDGGIGAIAAIAEHGGLQGAKLVVLSDVRTPFEQAAEVFGPQKGATPEQVVALTRRLQHQAESFPRDPRGVPMSGAAGGLSGGLWAACGAELRAGAPYVLEALGFDAQMRESLAVVTGEGSLDRQSLAGKIVGEVATRCRQAGVPCHAVVGRNDLDRFDARILDLQLIVEAGTEDELRAAGAQLAAALADQRVHAR